MKKKFRFRDHIFATVIFTFFIIYIVSLVVMLVWGILAAFKTNRNFIESPFGFPNPIVFTNFVEVFNILSVEVTTASGGIRTIYFEGMLLNSIIFSLVLSFISTLFPMVVAYLVSKYPYGFSRVIYSIVIVVMILPIVGSMPSEIRILQMLGLYDTFIGFMIMKMNFLGMYFLVFYAHFKSLPWEFAESAFVDGATHFTVLFRIMLPLTITTFNSVCLLNFIGYWNDYMSNAIYLPSMPTLAYGIHIKRFSGGAFGKATMQLATSVLLSLPLIALFTIFQNKLMGGLTVGGIKG